MDIEEALSILESEITSAKEQETALDFLATQSATRQAEVILQMLIKKLDYPDAGVQFHALLALENYSLVKGAAAAIQPLLSYLLDKEKIRDNECRGEAAYVVELYAKAQVPTSELAIEPLLQTMSDTHEMVREFSLDALCQFANSAHAPHIAQSLIKALSTGSVQPAVVYTLLYFAKVPGIEAAIQPLVQLSNSKTIWKRLIALKGLAELGSVEVLPILQVYLHDEQKDYINNPYTGEVELVAVSELAQYAIQQVKERAKIED